MKITKAARRRSTAVAAMGSAVLLVGPPAVATHSIVEAPVTGSAYGYYTNVSLFGGPYESRGPAPTVTLASDASNSPQDAHLDSAEAV